MLSTLSKTCSGLLRRRRIKQGRAQSGSRPGASAGGPGRVAACAAGSFALTHMHRYGILMHMRTTLIIDDDLLAQAQQLSGLREKTAVLHAGLKALIARENARRLAALGGTERGLKPIARRRTRPRADAR